MADKTDRAADPTVDDTPKNAKPADTSLVAFYGDPGKSDVGPKVKKATEDIDGAKAVAASGKFAEAAHKVINDHLKTFQICLDEALHRNPGLKVGSLLLTVRIGTSGMVKDARIDKFTGTNLGECTRARAKALVFPPPEDPTDIEIPLKLGASVGR